MNRLFRTALCLTTTALIQTALAQTTPVQTAPAQTASADVVTSDSATRTVKVNLVAGQGDSNRGLNYNGASKGEKTLTVPLGWTVEVNFSNAGKAPHNAMVMGGEALPTTFSPARVPFPGAVTKVIAPGGAGETTKFVANRPGSYYVLCAVGKHAQNGMYLKLVVVNSIKAATYQ